MKKSHNMLGYLTFLSLLEIPLACAPDYDSKVFSVTLNGIQNLGQDWTVNPRRTREQLVANLKEGARKAVRTATGFKQGEPEMRALTWNFDRVNFLQCQDIFEMQDTTLTTTITELVGVTHYCLQKDGVIKGICTGKNCNSKEMTQVPAEYSTWNFQAALDLSNTGVALKWQKQMPLDQLRERIQAQLREDMFGKAALYFN